jgi:hypothetical protein
MEASIDANASNEGLGVAVVVMLAVRLSVLEADDEEELDGVIDDVGVNEIVEVGVGVTERVEVGVGVTEIVEDGVGVAERVDVDVVDTTKQDVAPRALVLPAGHSKQAVLPVEDL